MELPDWEIVEWEKVHTRVPSDLETQPGETRRRWIPENETYEYLIHHDDGQGLVVRFEGGINPIVSLTFYGELYLHRCVTNPPSPSTEIPSTNFRRGDGPPEVTLTLYPYV